MSSYHLTDLSGRSESEPSLTRMREALAELASADDEHPDVTLTHEPEWTLGAYRDGTLVWEHLERGAPRHMKSVTLDRVIELWEKLSSGGIEEIQGEPWLPGYASD